MSDEKTNDYNRRNIGTGSASAKEYVIKVCPFEKYEIVVKLTSDGRFIGIEEVRVNKDFRSHRQGTSQRIFEYIEEYPSE